MRDRVSFGHILETLEGPRAVAGQTDRPHTAFANPFSTATAPIRSDGDEHPGVENLWDHAFAWIPDSPPPDSSPELEARAAPAPEPPTPGDDLETVAAELGLTSASTSGELHRARRRFMWRNHPDRRPDIPPDLANRRVAIANMLVDRALKLVSRGAR